jgi:autotransporter-associated beta strand protein
LEAENVRSENQRRVKSQLIVAAAAGAVAGLVFAGQARATSGNWLGAADATWGGNNWDVSPVPGPGETATFNGPGNGNTTIDLGAGVTVGNIVFDTAGVAAYTVGSGGVGAQTLTFDTAAAGNALTLSSTIAANQTVNANILVNTADSVLRLVNSNVSTTTPATLIVAGTIESSTTAATTVNTTGSVTLNGAVNAGAAPSISIANVSAQTLTLGGTGTSNLSTLRATDNGLVVVDGQTVNVAASSRFGRSSGTSGDFDLRSGAANFNGGITTTNTVADGTLIKVSGGAFTASAISLGRTGNPGTNLPASVTDLSGLVVTGGNASVTGNVDVGTSNSAATALVNGGSLTVGGQFAIGNTTNTRYSVLEVRSGSFTSTDATNGVVLSTHNATANRSALLLTGGTSTIERIAFGDADSVAGSVGAVVLNNGTLYLGSGGMVVASPNAYATTVNLTAGTLGAKADWSSSVPMALNGTGVTIKAADAADAPFNITLGGQLTGTGSITKTGGGTLTLSGPNWTGVNNYNANIAVNAGTLAVDQSTNGTYGGVVSGPGAFAKTGSGTFTMSNAQAYTGATTVAGGTLAINGAQATSGVTVQSGAGLALAGNATVNALTLGSGPGDTQTLRVNTGSGVNGLGVLTTDALVAHGTTTIDVGSIGVSVGDYTVLDYAGAIGGTGGGFAAFTLGSLPPRVVANLFDNAGNSSIDLKVTGVDFPRWTGATDGNWDIGTLSPASGTPNWKEVTSGSTTVYLQSSAPGDLVIFDDTATGTTTVNITTPVSPAAMTVNNTTKDYTFTGAKISGPGQLIKQGAGTLTISNTGNDYTGGTVIQGGTVLTGGVDTLPVAGNLTLTGGTLNLNGGLQNISGAFVLDGGTVFFGQINKTGAAYELRSGTVHASATLAGAVAANKTTEGTVVITGTSTYTGGTTVSAGTLQLGDGVTNGFIAGNIANTGTVAFNNASDQDWNGAITGATGSIVKDGPGALNVTGENQGNVTVNAGKITASGNGNNSRLARFGNLTINNGARVEVGGINALGLGVGTNPPRTILNPGGTLFTTEGSDTAIYNATFAGGELTGSELSTINMRGDYLASAGTTSILSHPSINRSNTPDFTIEAGATLNVTGVLLGGDGYHKRGPGTMTLSGVNTYSGTTTVDEGTLLVANADGLGVSPVNVIDGALAQVQASLPKAVTVTTLNTNLAGKFDLTNNSMVVKGMTDAQVQTLLASGYNAGGWNGATGILSATAAASTETSVGFATQAQLGLTEFKGVSALAATDVLVKYTYAGDANLDGKVDIGDLGLLAGAWQQASGKVWFDGDFTYDGAVNIGDLGLLAGNWQKGTAGNPNPPLLTFDQALAQFSAFEGVVVPEPTGLGLLGIAAAGLLARRRRRSA